MPTTYSPSTSGSLTLAYEQTSDGDKRKAASINPGLSTMADDIAKLAFGQEAARLYPGIVTGTSGQVLNATVSDRYIVPKGTLPGSPVNLILFETGMLPGARMRVCFQELNIGANVWRFFSGTISNPQLLHIDNTAFTPDLYTNVEFYFATTTHWAVLECDGCIVSIP